jgi:hypothetical protein
MKQSNLFLSVAFVLCTLSAPANTDSNPTKVKDAISSKIVSYLSTIDYSHDLETVSIFSDFLFNENGDLFNVDFMINEKGEMLIYPKILKKNFIE